jgi:putative peptide zinc metalloprotease protein
MNIGGCADSAIWQTASERVRPGTPKLDPRVIAHEQIEGGVRTVLAMQYGGEGFYRLSPDDWTLMQLFDGQRSFGEVAQEFEARAGIRYTEEQLAEFVDAFRDTELFYKTPSERNLALMEALVRDRKRRRRKKLDLSDIVIITWNSNPYFDWLYPKLKFIYTRWFTLLTLAWFAFMIWVLWNQMGELWNDSLTYYNFTQKSLYDLAEFWFSFAFVVFFHESAHGLTCKHWGARVHRMGFTLFYLAPTFYCDVSEAYLYGGKWQRISIMFAGAWIELMMCSFAALVWWGTVPGMLAHELAYTTLLVAGIAIIVLNLNPLIKLDGYYILCELIGIPDLKERSTAYLTNWVRSMLGLPVRLDYLRRRRKWFFIVYATLSAIYGCVLLFVAVTITYNVSRRFTPEWAFLVATVAALLMFKTPLLHFGGFMKTLQEHHQEHWNQIFTPVRLALGWVVLLVFLLLPIWRETIEGQFITEASQRAVVRAEVAGNVLSIVVAEGHQVNAGSEIARLRNLALESEAAESRADLKLATARTTNAQLHYTGFAQARQEQNRLAEQVRNLDDEVQKLSVRAPISGIVVTPRPSDLIGAYVPAGTTIAEIAQLSPLRVRIYLPEFAMREFRLRTPAALHFDQSFQTLTGTVTAMAPASAEPPEGIAPKLTYKGQEMPNYFVADVYVDNPGNLRERMTGSAKIMVAHRSAAGLAWKALRNFAGRRFW